MSYDIKTIKEEFKSKGIFYTPEKLSLLVKSFVDVETREVYDPTCGNGSLLSVFENDVAKYGQEINQHQLDVAEEKLTNFTGYCGDTLKNPAFKDKKFKCIVANPPFSIGWDRLEFEEFKKDERFESAPAVPPKSKADYVFLLHILHYLANDGVAVVLNFPGILYRGNTEGKIRKWIVEQNYIDKVIRIPGKTFVDTPIETVILVLKKNKINTDIEFVDSGDSKRYIAKFEEVKENDFNLSVSQYIIEEDKKESINPEELQNKARKQMLSRIKKDIEIDRIVCELEGIDFTSYLYELQKLIISCYE